MVGVILIAAIIYAIVQPSTSAPAPTDTPAEAAPTDTEEPAPTDTEEPAPTDTEEPSPEETATEKPEATKIPGSDLIGPIWILDGYRNEVGEFTTPLESTQITLIFEENGTLIGESGCNTYSGSYETDGTNIIITGIMATGATCSEPEGIMEQEAAYVLLLQEVDTYRVEGAYLELFNTDEVTVLTYSG
jgi:heat shock protein HslJ